MCTDPHLWLEEVEDEKALDWVRARNDLTVAQFTQNDRFRGFQERIRTILDSDDRIPMFEACGDTLYNFWQDKDHPKGIWRRTTLEEYRKDRPEWEVVLDLDALAQVRRRKLGLGRSTHLSPRVYESTHPTLARWR